MVIFAVLRNALEPTPKSSVPGWCFFEPCIASCEVCAFATSLLLLQCFPMAYLVEQAGGSASTGTQRILDIVPTQIHERWGKCHRFLRPAPASESAFSTQIAHLAFVLHLVACKHLTQQQAAFGKGAIESCFYSWMLMVAGSQSSWAAKKMCSAFRRCMTSSMAADGWAMLAVAARKQILTLFSLSKEKLMVYPSFPLV